MGCCSFRGAPCFLFAFNLLTHGSRLRFSSISPDRRSESNTRFRISKLLFIKGNVGILLVLQFHHLGDDGFHSGIVFHKLHSLVDHKIFQPLFTDGLFLAALVPFGSGTFIVAVDFTRPARAAFAKHQRPTVAA